MHATGKRRLLTLANFLETEVPRKRFDMGTWADEGFEVNKCGTAACALGWACTIPSFKRAGFRFDGGGEPSYRFHCSYGAAAAFFDIDRDDARDLFSTANIGQTPKEVAQRIRDLVASSKSTEA